MSMTVRAKAPLATFALLTTCIYAVAVSVSRMRALEHPEVVALGLMFDLLVTVPLAYYLLAVRRGGWSPLTLGIVVSLSFAGATLVFPGERALLGRLFQIVSIPAELGIVTWVAVRTWRSVRRGGRAGADDLPERLRNVARDVLPLRRVADAISFEMTILTYALFAWRRRPHAPADQDAFSYHQKSGYGAIVFALMIITLAEAVPIHILVTRWSPLAAWVLTALSAYGIFWFLADWRATRLRPHLLDEDALQIRTGLRWSVRIPRERIAALHTKLPPGAGPVLRAALPGASQLWLELDEPVSAEGPYGIERRARWIAVAVDDRERFRQALGR
ncbi:MAG TPA: hypothetical protein VLQ45_12740 [Thermoanaerobaculia bacterium]|nr:hypothetical protein [Thermoanaerobaculia bacterium]